MVRQNWQLKILLIYKKNKTNFCLLVHIIKSSFTKKKLQKRNIHIFMQTT